VPVRLYVVEDYSPLAQLLRAILSDEGYAVVVAANGLEALQLMRLQPPDVVVLDVGMPVMDGFSLARRMKADPGLASVPILYLTAHADYTSRVTGFETGADDYLAKPFETQELLARLRAILRRTDTGQNADRDIISAAASALDLASGTIEIDGRRVSLTPAEAALLRYLMLRAGTPVSAQQLLTDVFDYPPNAGDTSLIRHLISSIRQKIEPDPTQPRHVQTVSARGYRFC
jgi:DNA-binding response OmpR family regulator